MNSSYDDIYEHYTFSVDPGQALMRIDKWLLQKTKHITRSKIKKCAEEGLLLVNEKPVKVSYKIKPGDEVKLFLPYPPKSELVPEDLPLEVVYEDEELMVVHKPQGMVVHPASGNYSGTLMNAILYYLTYKTSFPKIPEDERLKPSLVHRIDKGTSGLLVVAKTEDAFHFLSKQFMEKTTRREYYAFVWGNVKRDKGTVNANLGRSRNDRKKYTVYKEGGKPSVTHYEVLLRFPTATLVRCVLETGRTHQIRVHMKSIGHPLFGDDVYGGNRIVIRQPSQKYKRFIHECLTLMPTQALHAKTLGFVHPKTKEQMFFTSNLPENFKAVIQKFSEYYQVEIPSELRETF